MADCPNHPGGECIKAFGFPCTVYFGGVPLLDSWGYCAGGAKVVPMAQTLRDFGGNTHRDRHVSSPLFRAACLVDGGR